MDIEFTKIVKTLVITVGAAALMATAVAAVSTTLFLIAGFGIAKSALAAVVIAASFVASANTNQEINPNTNLNAPTSPTDGFVPDPKGTATNPTGKITLTDIDGNIYHAVRIGTQTWMLENLKTARYNDGTAIPNVTDDPEWTNITSPAYCWFNNDNSNKNKYGALYNWYAVNDPRGLAPVGWHVPTDAEWTTLITDLGGGSVAGGKLKEIGTTHWREPNNEATNETGFTALPAGGFYGAYGFLDINNGSSWWSTTKITNDASWERYISFDSSIDRDTHTNSWGNSIRCIKDK